MTVKILTGDCRDILKTLPNESVHCVVTSPPYWGLRDYGTAQWEGGDLQCDHVNYRSVGASTLKNDGREKIGYQPGNKIPTANPFKEICGKCGACRIDNQLGMERSLDEHVETMVQVFREVRRVLRSDGTLWLNYGDSYAANVNGRSASDTKALGQDDRTFRDKPFSTVGGILKPKDLCGIPWRVAFALQADGWYLRQDIIWSKPNPMPESVTDRCTKAHEYIFLLSKSARYYYDADSIREEPTGRTDPIRHFGNGKHAESHTLNYQLDGLIGRNKRSVWTVATQPFSEAHFATFPPALIEPCVMAGCPKGGTVLDPFGGAGTTGMVADRLQRDAILIELNSQYAKMAEDRIKGDAPLFADVSSDWDDMWSKPFHKPEYIADNGNLSRRLETLHNLHIIEKAIESDNKPT